MILRSLQTPVPDLRNGIPTPSEARSALAECHSDAVGTPFRICGTHLIYHS